MHISKFSSKHFNNIDVKCASSTFSYDVKFFKRTFCSIIVAYSIRGLAVNSKEMKHRMKNIDLNPDFWRQIRFHLKAEQTSTLNRMLKKERDDIQKIILLSNHAMKKVLRIDYISCLYNDALSIFYVLK